VMRRGKKLDINVVQCVAVLVIPSLCSSDQNRLTSFTPLSVVVGRMVRAVHRCLFMVLSSESSAIVTTQVLKCLATVIANVPYQRLRPGLLGSAVKQIRPFLSHRGKLCVFQFSICS